MMLEDPFKPKKVKKKGYTKVQGNIYQNEWGQYFEKKGKSFKRISDI